MWRLFDDGQWWRLITAVFLHGSLMHLVFNMWVIMDIGPMVEELFGSARYLFLYVATGLFGYVISSFFGHYSVGASGALLGLIGLLLASTTRSSSASSQMMRSNLIKWIVYIAIMGFMFSGIDNYAHFGGLAAGFGLGKLFVDRPPQGQGEMRVANILGWGTAILVIGCFALMMYFFLQKNRGTISPQARYYSTDAPQSHCNAIRKMPSAPPPNISTPRALAPAANLETPPA
jgi:hypothetical protein